LDQEQTLTLDIPSDASSISANQEYEQGGNSIKIKGKSIELSYLTSESLQKSRGGYYFVDKVKFSSDFNKADIKFLIDTGSFLDNENIYPSPTRIETDGRQILVIWELNNVKQGDDVPIFLTIESPSSSNSIIWMIIIIVLIILIYMVYKFYPKKGKKIEDIDKYLVESEKAIIAELKKADRGELWQKQLQLKTNFSKAKLSRLVRNLESRNVIEKIPFGNTNKVRLK
ncbi:MAG TPA: hypothetical protein VI544_00605, partial [Candidatus Nanoarchaeia archaeon]|nr:hypothetical protein [Candidatus Nanoarchaeia archaeon]